MNDQGMWWFKKICKNLICYFSAGIQQVKVVLWFILFRKIVSWLIIDDIKQTARQRQNCLKSVYRKACLHMHLGLKKYFNKITGPAALTKRFAMKCWMRLDIFYVLRHIMKVRHTRHARCHNYKSDHLIIDLC